MKRFFIRFVFFYPTAAQTTAVHPTAAQTAAVYPSAAQTAADDKSCLLFNLEDLCIKYPDSKLGKLLA